MLYTPKKIYQSHLVQEWTQSLEELENFLNVWKCSSYILVNILEKKTLILPAILDILDIKCSDDLQNVPHWLLVLAVHIIAALNAE